MPPARRRWRSGARWISTEKVGQTLCRLSRLSWLLGRNDEAEHHGRAAVAALETLPPGHELALAYGNLAHLGTRATDSAAALFWGERAIALAERLGDLRHSATPSTAWARRRSTAAMRQGRAKLERSLAIALEHGFEEHVARAYANLAIYWVVRLQVPRRESTLQDGIAYCAERDLDPWGHFLRWAQARARLDQGDWLGAEEDATAILSVPWMAVTNRIPALLVLGRVRARRGDPGARAALDEARDLALAVGEPQRIEQVAAARAEWRWLQGDLLDVWPRSAWPVASHSRSSVRGTRASWWSGSGAAAGLTTAPEGTFAPYALQIAGDWRAAAEAWERIGCPWEQALALLDGDEAAQRVGAGDLRAPGRDARDGDHVASGSKSQGARGLPAWTPPSDTREPAAD